MPPLLFSAVFKTPTSCLETLYICMFLQLLSNSSSLQHVTKSQISASAHPAVPTEEALQVWDVIKRHPEVPTQWWQLWEWEVSCTTRTVTPDSGFSTKQTTQNSESSLTTPAMPSFPKTAVRPTVCTCFHRSSDIQLIEIGTTGTHTHYLGLLKHTIAQMLFSITTKRVEQFCEWMQTAK